MYAFETATDTRKPLQQMLRLTEKQVNHRQYLE